MAMSVNYAVKTSLRKYNRHKLRTVFGIAPFILLLIILVIFTNLTSSITSFIDNKIIRTIEIKESQIRIAKIGGKLITDPFSTEPGPQTYSTQDLEKVRNTEHVISTSMQKTLPNIRVVTTDLVDNKELHVQNIKLASSESMKPYLQKDFTYNLDQPIPIVLNKDVFNYAYIDMQGNSKIALTDEELRDEKLRQEMTPLKVEFLAHEYDVNELLGKTFSAKVGGFPAIPQVASEAINGSKVNTFSLRTPEEINRELRNRMDVISPYWDYDLLNDGIELEFQIVGFNEDQDNTANFIPMNAGAAVFQQIYDLQKQSRTSLELPKQSYGDTFGGLRLALNNTLAPSGTWGIFYAVDPPEEEFIAPPAAQVTIFDYADYIIPGWVYASKVEDGEKIPYDVVNLGVTPEIFPITDIIALLDDASNRTATINSLIDGGFYELQNTSGIIDQTRMVNATLERLSSILIAILFSLSVFLLITLAWRFIVDAQREIGVYRALGATTIDVSKLYIVYTAMQVLIGITVGLIIGLVLTRTLSNYIATIIYDTNILPWLNTKGDSLNGVQLTLNASDLYYIDFGKLAFYVGILITLSILASLIPAWRAAHVSPVEAIRNSD